MPATPKFTIATVNKALMAAGHPERLARGRGYFYFYDGEASMWPATSVYVFNLDAFTAAEWVAERDELATAAARAGWGNSKQRA